MSIMETLAEIIQLGNEPPKPREYDTNSLGYYGVAGQFFYRNFEEMKKEYSEKLQHIEANYDKLDKVKADYLIKFIQETLENGR